MGYNKLIEVEVKKVRNGGNMNPTLYPNVTRLMKLKRSLPVSSAEAERSFSIMKREKTPYRNRLDDTRMSDLALLSAESDIAKSIDLDDLVRLFGQKDIGLQLK